MNRISVLSLVVVACGIAVILATAAESQVGPPKQGVALQPSTPGTSQSGHSNVSGTSRAGQFMGGGAGLTGVNADLLDGINSTGFAQSSHNHDAAAILSGTLADARLSANVAFLGATQTFAGLKTFSAAPNFTAAGSPFTVAGTGLVTNLNADRLDGLNSSNFLQSIPNPLSLTGSSSSGSIMSAENSATGTGHAIHGFASASSGQMKGVVGSSQGSNGIGVLGMATSTSGANCGVWGQSSSPTGIGVHGEGGTEGVRGYTQSGYGVRGFAQSGSGVGVAGQYGDSFNLGWLGREGSGAGGESWFHDGVSGLSSGGGRAGVLGTTTSTSGYGIKGTTTVSGANFGVYGSSISGSGVYGTNSDTGSFGTLGTPQFGIHASGPIGGSGFMANSAGTSNTAQGAGPNFGLYGNASGSSTGVRGQSVSGAGVWGTSSLNDAILGQTFVAFKSSVFGFTDTENANGGYFISASTTGSGDGVIGHSNSAGGYGVYAIGVLGATGSKTFRIDHPLDPENKFLTHSSIESPEVLNLYRGNIVLDGQGEA